MSNIASASNLGSNPKISMVILTSGRHDFSGLIKEIDAKFDKCKVEFIIAPKDGVSPVLRDKLRKSTKSELYVREPGEVLDRIVYTFDILAARKPPRRPHALLFLPDDFNWAVETLPKFVEPVLEKADAALAKCDGQYKIYMPYSMYLCEMGASCAVSYLLKQNPAEMPPTFETMEQFAKEASQRRAFHETYTGFMAFSPEGWVEAKRSLDEIFFMNGGYPALPNFAIEQGLLLSVLQSNISYEIIEVPRRYEHPLLASGSKEEGDFARKRAGVFIDALVACSTYANKFAPEKKSNLVMLASQVQEEIAVAGFNYPDHDIQYSNWNKNSTIKTTFG